MKTLIFIWAITLLMDNLLPLVVARFYPNYIHKETALSVLGSRQSPVKWIYNIWCIVSGIVFCIAPYALYLEHNCGLAMAIWVLLAIYGIGCEIISGICPLNENRQDEDIITKIHGGSSAIGFMALLIVPLLLALLQLQISEFFYRNNLTFILCCGICVLLFLCYGRKRKVFKYSFAVWRSLAKISFDKLLRAVIHLVYS